MSRIKMGLLAAACLGLTGLGLGTTAQADEPQSVPTYKEFKAATFTDADGAYIVNGDEALRGNAALKAYYERMVNSNPHEGLIVNQVNGEADAWSDSQVGNLTYCVSDRFGTSKSTVVAAMQAGGNLWENQSSAVDFRYVPAQDATCNTSNRNVLFSVEPTNTTSYIARAFFPSSPKSARNVLVNARSLQNSGEWTPANILSHELGHTLGFRHEHTRPEAGTCFEDNNWLPLTPYDDVSIMHYPQCNGGSTNLTFSAQDGVGVRALYGS